MNDTFYDGHNTSSITMQTLGKIAQRAPAVRCEMCLFVFFLFFLPAVCREAANCRY